MLGWFTPQVFLGRAQRRLMARGVMVYCYHKVSAVPAATRDPFLYVTPGAFEAQLAALRTAGFGWTTLDQMAEAGNAGRNVVITFDDGFVNVLEHGLPALKRHQCSAMQFLVAGSLGGRNEWDVAKGDVPEKLMDETQVREWLAAGQQIGSHTMTHRNLRKLPPAEAREEIFASKKSLEDRFGREIRHFCYPYGSWNEAVRDLVGEAGYATACTLLEGTNESTTPRFELRRIIPLSSSELTSKALHRTARKLRSA